MNKTYNVIFNKSIGEYQVTSELVSNRKKTKSSKRAKVFASAFLIAGITGGSPLVGSSGDLGNHQVEITESTLSLNLTNAQNSAGNESEEDTKKLTNIATWTNAQKDNVWGTDGNWQSINSDGAETASSSFISGSDYAQFRSYESNENLIKVGSDVIAGGIYFIGNGSYKFELEAGIDGINTQEFQTTYLNNDWGYEERSFGKLVLGQELIQNSENNSLSYQPKDFSGVVDLTGTTKNFFEKGVEIYSGALRISSIDQIVGRDQPDEWSDATENYIDIQFNGQSADKSATLYIADKLVIDENKYTNNWVVAEGSYGLIQAESGGELFFKGTGEDDGYPPRYNFINNYGTLTIDGARFQGLVRHPNGSLAYNIFNSGDLTLNNYWHEDSLPILNRKGTLTIENATFTKNRASALLSYDTPNSDVRADVTLILKSVVFEDNIIDTDNYDEIYGVLFNRSLGTMKLEGSNFFNNHAIVAEEWGKGYGGAIYIDKWPDLNDGSRDLIATITTTNFINNSASDRGGAIYSGIGNLMYKGATLIIKDSLFEENKVIRETYAQEAIGGGAIYSAGDLTIEDSSFNKNSAIITPLEGEEIYYQADGGAILMDRRDDLLDIKNSQFTDNSATNFGGAIRASKIHLLNTDFTGNSSVNGDGGAIVGNDITFTVTGDHTSIFSGNTAKGESNSIDLSVWGLLKVNLEESTSILEMHDPLSGENAVVTKEGFGEWKLGGTTHLTERDENELEEEGRSLFTVKEGTLSLYHKGQVQDVNGYDVTAGIIKLDGKHAHFTVGSNGNSTRLVANGGNKILAKDGRITFYADENGDTNTTLRLHVTGENRLNDLNESAKERAVLDLEGQFEVTGGGKVNLEVFGVMAEGALYALLSSNQDHAFNANQFEYSASSINMTYLGRDISTIERLKSFNPLMINESGNALIFNNHQEDNGRLTAIATWKGDGTSNDWGSSADNNWSTVDSVGEVVENSIFMAGDLVNFTLLNEGYEEKWGTINLVLNEDDPNYKITSAGVYFSGGVSYKFSGEGFHTTIDKTTFDPSESGGKLVLGKKVESEEAGAISIVDADFWGTVDLTGTTLNSFEGGVEIHDGTLKISHEDQLGTTLDKLMLVGAQYEYYRKPATLAIAGDVQFNNQTFTMADYHYGVINLDDDSTLIFANNRDHVMLDNAASLDGLGLEIKGERDSNSIIFDNSNNNAPAIYNHEHGVLTLSGVLFKGNLLGSDAPIIKSDADAHISIYDTTFELNNQLGVEILSQGFLHITNAVFKDGLRGAIDSFESSIMIEGGGFFNNQRSDQDGGAVAASSLYTTDVYFLNNNAGKSGGAVAIISDKNDQSSMTILRSIFEGNEAEDHGGALYINTPLSGFSIGSGVIFDGNIARTGKGGAIYYRGNVDSHPLEISVKKQEYSAFKNNIANGKSNSIYLDGGILNLNLEVDGILDMQDPLAGAGSLEKQGLGIWMLGGENILHNENGSGYFNVLEGTLYLYGKEEIKNSNDEYVEVGTITLNGQDSEFNLGNDRRNTLLVANGGNAIKVPEGSINFHKGSNETNDITLEFTPLADNWISGAEQADYSNAVLGLYGAVNFSGSNKINVKINFSDLEDGFYTLLYSEKSNNFSDEHFTYIEDPEYFYQGKSLSSIGRALAPPLSYSDGNALIFQLGGFYADYHGVATWTGADSDAQYKNVWNHLLAENWETVDSSGATSTIFSNQDFVNFSLNDGEVHQVKVDEDIQTSGIYFSGNASYIFDGERLNTSMNDTTFYPRKSHGKLVLGRAITSAGSVLSVKNDEFTGVLDMTGLSSSNNFEGGIEVYGGTIKISDAGQLGGVDNLKLVGSEKNPASIVVDKQDVDMWGGDAFKVDADAHAQLIGSNGYKVIFDNKKSGAIVNSGILTLKNSRFINNSTSDSGGAIYNHDTGILDIHDSEFRSNMTRSIYESGGAIFNRGNLTISGDSTFNFNSGRFGGAISHDSYAGKLVVDGAHFMSNSALSSSGGAIYLGSDGTILNTLFEGNSSSYGGAIYVSSTYSTIIDSDFINNHVSGSGSMAAGAAIYVGEYSEGFDLIVSEGSSSLFSGNAISKGESRLNNSIHLDRSKLDIDIAQRGVLVMHDPLMGEDATITKQGEGEWKLGGISTFTGDNTTFAVNEGVLSLYRGNEIRNEDGEFVTAGSIDIAGANSKFTLGSDNQHVTLVANGGNSINVKDGAINFNAGSGSKDESLNFVFKPTVVDNWTETAEEASLEKAVLALSGAVNFIGNQKINVSVDLLDLDKGFYTLLYSDTATNFGDDKFAYIDTDYLYEGKALSSFGRAVTSPFSYKDGNALIFEVGDVKAHYHGIATWTGKDTTSEYLNTWKNLFGDNWETVDSEGETSTIFSNEDYVNFAIKDTATQQVKTEVGIQTSGVFISGAATYLFEGEGFSTAINETTFNPSTSSGKLVLGQTIGANGKDLEISNSEFTGVVDLTGTEGNHFAGGVEIYGGTLKISHQNQIGEAMADILFGGSEDNRANLLISDGDVEFPVSFYSGASLVINNNAYATVKAETGSSLTFTRVAMNQGNLALDNVIFTNNEGESSQAIRNMSNAELFMKDSRVMNIISAYEGAIINEGKMTIEGVTFDKNSSSYSGAVINNTGQLILKESVFTNNTAIYGGGGAINASGRNDSPIEIEGTLFSNNIAGIEGGAISNGGQKLVINNSIFLNNRAESDLGGAIYHRGGNGLLAIGNSDFSGNSADQSDGGAIFYTGQGYNLRIKNTDFNSNVAKASGGAIAITTYSGDSEMQISGGVFTGNKAQERSGGAIFISAIPSLNIDGTEFISNYAEKGAGGAISTDGAIVISNALFRDNKAATYGGAIYSYDGDLTITDTDFISNEAGSFDNFLGGGAIHFNGTPDDVEAQPSILTLNVTDAASNRVLNFSGNSANGESNSIFLSMGRLNINTAENTTLDMQDALSGDSREYDSQNNQVGDVIVTKLGSGNWKLGGNSQVFGDHAAFNINEGELFLYGKGQAQDINGNDIAAATIKLEGANSKFNLGSDNKHVTLVANGGNSINVKDGSIRFNAGSTVNESISLLFKLSEENQIADSSAASGANAVLALQGELDIQGSNQINVDVDVTDIFNQEGLYTLLFVGSNTLDPLQFDYTGNTTLRYFDRDISTIERLQGFNPLSLNNEKNALLFGIEDGKLPILTSIATWTNANKNNLWHSNNNWRTEDSDGNKVELSTFITGDLVNFVGTDNEVQQVKINNPVDAGGIYISGEGTFIFESEGGNGLTASRNETTFNGGMSEGALRIGAKIITNKSGSLRPDFINNNFKGIVDLTGTYQNNFSNVFVHSGALKISHQDQIGLLSTLRLLGNEDNRATLLISDGDALFATNDDRLTIASYGYATIKAEEGASLTFSNGKDGLALYNLGNLVLDNVIFKDNKAEGFSALYNEGADEGKNRSDAILVIKGSSFIDNISTSSGGAIHNKGQLMIESSSFDNNSSKYGGGLLIIEAT